MKKDLQRTLHARHRFAEILRRFYLGRMTNDTLEDASLPFLASDEAAREVFNWGVWCSYDDNREEPFQGPLTAEGRRTVSRWILFLKSGQPYLWPKSHRLVPAWIGLSLLFSGVPIACWTGRWEYSFLGFVILTIVGRIIQSWEQSRIFKSGDKKVWPFICQADYEEALQYPPYLNGQSLSP